MNEPEERRIINQLNTNGWFVLTVVTVMSIWLLPSDMLTGVLLGGFLAVGNLHLLRRVVAGLEGKSGKFPIKSMLIKYYIRFVGMLIFLTVILAGGYVDSLGLLLGLSVFILAVFVLVFQITGKNIVRNFSKEAV